MSFFVFIDIIKLTEIFMINKFKFKSIINKSNILLLLLSNKKNNNIKQNMNRYMVCALCFGKTTILFNFIFIL